MLFMLFNYSESFTLLISDWFRVIYHGLRLDLSAGAYLMLIPGIAVLIGFSAYIYKIIDVYVYSALFIIVLLGILDMELYSYWGFKLDITPILYLRTPGEALASIEVMEIIFLLFFVLIIFLLFLYIYRRFIKIPFQLIQKHNWQTMLVSLIFTSFLILPARGGIGLAALNVGAVYFHSVSFANHSAINVLWNTLYSVSERKKLISSFEFMSSEDAENLIAELHKKGKNSEIIVKEKANIILIILESFSNKIIEPLGGEPGITPVFNRLCSEGLIFRNFYSSGDRSDKGLVSIFSGFPSQPLTSIINYPSKTQTLPFLTDPFSENDYSTSFYYGGNLDFANFRSYFTRASLHQVIDINHFPRTLRNQKWGVSDNFVYEKILKDLDNKLQPFFISFFTLSSHEPFDVPADSKFGSGRDELSRNAFFFADSCLGVFINEARQKPWWENTLVILLPDHGSRSPGNTLNYSRQKFSIPMLWIGGALLSGQGENTVYGSQVDFPAIILNQFGYSYENFKYSKDILSRTTKGYAYYTFNNGFGFMKDSCEVIYDNINGSYIHKSGDAYEKGNSYGKALLQLTTKDFLKR